MFSTAYLGKFAVIEHSKKDKTERKERGVRKQTNYVNTVKSARKQLFLRVQYSYMCIVRPSYVMSINECNQSCFQCLDNGTKVLRLSIFFSFLASYTHPYIYIYICEIYVMYTLDRLKRLTHTLQVFRLLYLYFVLNCRTYDCSWFLSPNKKVIQMNFQKLISTLKFYMIVIKLHLINVKISLVFIDQKNPIKFHGFWQFFGVFLIKCI